MGKSRKKKENPTADTDSDRLSEGGSSGYSHSYTSKESTTKKYHLRSGSNRDSASEGEGKDDLERSNGYAALAGLQEEEENEASSDSEEEDQPRTQEARPALPRKEKPPPPLVFTSSLRDSHKALISRIQQSTKYFHVVHRQEDTAIYFDVDKDKQDFINKNSNQYDMYTYSNRTKQTRAFVVRGMPTDCTAEDIKIELLELGQKVDKTYLLKKTKYPLFMVVLEDKVTPAQLNKNCQYLSHAKVRWEWYKTTKRLTQCRRCQRWGHAAGSCLARSPRCLKCAQPHETRACQKTPDTPASCANCTLDHPANFNGCAAYQNYKAARERAAAQARTRQQPRTAQQRRTAGNFRPAPPPMVNPWTRNQEAQPSAPPPKAPGEAFPPLPGPAHQRPTHQEKARSQTAGTSPRSAASPGTSHPPPNSRPSSPEGGTPTPSARQDAPHPMPAGWTRLSRVVDRINTEIDLDWIATQLELYVDTILSTYDPDTHVLAHNAYVKAIRNGRP